jgi:hypothetical protein
MKNSSRTGSKKKKKKLKNTSSILIKKSKSNKKKGLYHLPQRPFSPFQASKPKKSI